MCGHFSSEGKRERRRERDGKKDTKGGETKAEQEDRIKWTKRRRGPISQPVIDI